MFLPLTLFVVLGVSSLGQRTAAKLLLFAASVVFYAWWNPRYVALLLALITFNYVVGTWLIDTRNGPHTPRKYALVFGVVVNLAALAYFKYANFFVVEIGKAFGHPLHLAPILLPLGISFMVFQKIAFLVDAFGGGIKRLSLLDYAVFVSFFPQLIAGPIVHHREVIPQLEQPSALRYSARLTPIAISFFVIGAFKKVVIADAFSPYVGSLFEKASGGAHLGLIDAWSGALAYTLQVYFDFSGYSDIAIGLGLLFGIRLPINFNSPLKATGPIDYWNRWHITLTRFLMAYIYTPLVMRATRRRLARRKPTHGESAMRIDAFIMLIAVPTTITMFLAGVWHGAGYQFIVFGLIHGAYLVANQAWRNLRAPSDDDDEPTVGTTALCRFAMFVGAVAAVPFFRADSVATALQFIRGMAGLGGSATKALGGAPFAALILAGLFIVQVLPNTYELLHDRLDRAMPALARHAGTTDVRWQSSWPRIVWRPSVAWAIVLGLVAWYALMSMAKTTEFLYFQF
ncbi:MAG TPA: MBOAT family O-acyltransferase [Kofleriaceae bacterium]